MLPLCREERIGVIPYSPLAAGRLTRDWSSTSTLRSETDQITKRTKMKADRAASLERRRSLLVFREREGQDYHPSQHTKTRQRFPCWPSALATL
jgi:aryl-alcohol dehydrogenase-like predicted oxidoreductase